MLHDMRFSEDTKSERSVNRARSPVSRDNSVNTRSCRALQVRIERSIAVNAKQEDSHSVEGHIHISPKSVRNQGRTV